MKKVIENAYAKINLTLDVLFKRHDGYHEVEMIMQQVELHDIVELTLQEGGITLAAKMKDLPDGPDNLAYRAAALLKEYTGVKHGVHIHLIKRIPVAAGLAGGSTDAAAVLRGLNILWDLGLSFEQLRGIGARLGSDVPFCIQGGTALAKGRGEILIPVLRTAEFGIILVKPPFSVSTKDVYEALRLEAVKRRPDNVMVLQGLKEGNLSEIIDGMGNVLETVTACHHPEIQAIKDLLVREGALASLMSGSGPTVFGIVADSESGEQIEKRLKARGYEVYFTKPKERINEERWQYA